MLLDHLLNIMKEFKNLEKQVIQNIYTETNYSTLVLFILLHILVDLARRTISDKILNDRAYEIARNCNFDGYERALESMIYKFFDKKTGWGVIATSKAKINVSD